MIQLIHKIIILCLVHRLKIVIKHTHIYDVDRKRQVFKHCIYTAHTQSSLKSCIHDLQLSIQAIKQLTKRAAIKA